MSEFFLNNGYEYIKISSYFNMVLMVIKLSSTFTSLISTAIF